MPLICLRPGKSKCYCENKMCNKRLIGKFKILRRGDKGYTFYVCMFCFEGIIKKGGPDRYLPGKQTFNVGEAAGVDESSGAKLHTVEIEPYIPIGTRKLEGEIKMVTNHKTGQIML